MKEAEGCHNPRGVVNQTLIRGSPNGETHLGKPKIFLSEFIGQKGERRELKHLSNVRKRKQSDSLSSGERNGNSPNLYYVIACARCNMGVARYKCSRSTFLELYLFSLIELFWKGRPKKVIDL